MSLESRRTAVSFLALAGIRPLSAHLVRGVVAVIVAVCPPVVFASLAQRSGEWDLFERSGSITAAIGFIVASRQYVQHSILELAARANQSLKSELAEIVEEVSAAKLGLALSGFGMVISGWGKYLGWWSFAYLMVWALFVMRDIYRDYICLRRSKSRASSL